MKSISASLFPNKILLVLFSILTISSTNSTSNPENYAKELIEVLQKENVKVYEKFYPTCEEFKNSILESITDSIKRERFAKEYTEEKCQEELSRNYDRYEQVITNGKQLGIVWKSIKYENIEYKVESGDFGMSSIYKTKVFFSCNDNSYYVEIKGLGKLKNGWNGGKIYGPRMVE